jgi:hypothetical protein
MMSSHTSVAAGLPLTTIRTLRVFFALHLSERRRILAELGAPRGAQGSDFERDRASLLWLKDKGRLNELADKLPPAGPGDAMAAHEIPCPGMSR